MRQILVVIGRGHVQHLAGVAQPDGRKGLHFLGFQGHQNLFRVGENAALALGALLGLGQVIEAEHHVLRGNGDGVAGGRRKNVVRGQHQHTGFDLRLGRKRNVHRHLVAVEIGIEGRADQRVNLDRLALDQHRLKGLNAQTVQGGSAVQHYRMVLDDLFQNVPHRLLHLHHFFRLLDGGAMAGLLQAVIDEGLEEFERHLLGQSALVQLQLRAHHDHRTAGVIHALAQQILPEAALLALQRIGERLQWTVVRSSEHTAAAAVVEQRVDGLLQHALLVAHNHFRRVQVHQLLQPVVAVDHAAIEIVQIRSGKPAAIQRHQRAQLGRNHRQHVQDHPLRLVVALAEGFDNLQALGVLQLFLRRGFRLHPLAQFDAQLVDLHALEQLLDRLRAHHRLEPRRTELRIQLAVLSLVLDDLAFLHRRVARIDHHIRFEVEDGFQIAKRNVQQVADA